GDILAIGIISTDISEQKRIEQELRKARDQLEIRVAERTEELRAEISERERAEKSARENEALLRAIFDNSTAFLHVKTPDGKYVIGNNAFLEWAGIDQQDFAGKTAFDISSKKQAGKASKYDRQVAETGKPATFERETIYADGEVGMMQVIKFPIPDSDGTISRIGTLATDITDLKNAERAHRESEAALRAIFDHSDALIQLKDADGKYLLANNAFLEWSGMSPEDYIGKTVEDHAARGLAEQIAGYDRTVLETGQSVNVEQSTEHEDGQARVMHLTKFPIPDANGKITRIGTLATDITQIKKAEEALRERERLLRAVIDNLPSAVSLMDADQCITLVNAEWARNHGVDPEFAIGKPLPEIGSEQEIEQAAAHDNRVLESGNPFEFEIETVRSDGLPQTFVCVKFPIPGQDGTPIGIGSTFTNITERKRAEEALRWSERDLRGILDNMVDTFVRTDRNGRIIMVSPSVSQLLGTTTEETLGREIRSFFADPAGYDELISQLGKNDGELESHEMKFQRPDGVEVWVLATARYYFDDDGDIAGIEGVTHDITMRKRAEEALHRSEDRFRDFAEATSDWMWESDADMRITYVSARLFETTGLMPKNVVGKTWEELRIADDDDERWAAHKDLVGARKPFRDLEYCLINDAGERRTLRVSGKPRFDETGEFLGYRGTGTDVTQQRAAEKREARTRQRFLDAIETVPVGFALFDSEDRLALWNKLYESTGAPEFDLRTGISFEEIIHQSVENGAIGNAAGREDEWIEKRLEQHRNPTGPFMVLRGGRWLQIREHKTPDNSTLLVVVDITDLQRAEESLRESERQLKAFINSIPDIAWLKDAENRFIAVNESFARLAGREISAIIGKTDLDIWPPDLAKGYWDNDEEVKWSKDTMRNEEIVEHPDRSRVWHDTIKAPLLDEYDQVVGTVGTGRDVTDRKNAEDELRKLSAAVEQSPAAILITDPDGMLEYANPKYFVTTGFEPDEVLGRTPVFFGSGDANPGLFQRIYRTVGSGREWRSEGRYRRKNGEYYWSSLAVSPITNADGSISHLLGIAEDTSEKRKMDEQLRHAQKLEAVGTLAGGVAHDFNNILTGILGHCHIAVEKMPANADIGFNLDQITVASNRARDLVQQLLAFSRRRESDLRPVGLHAIVDEAVKLVHASIPSTIKIDWHVADDAGVVMADPTQIHQVLLNLCGNASDAIGDKAGEINVKVENITSDSSIPVSQSNLEPGSYARLSVADN
ncbi:MAG: PAS domain S-box protein, partial [Rhodospirillales bacterium]|nr:PAS domain S-box protein [Rhodospirillales bacterium]